MLRRGKAKLLWIELAVVLVLLVAGALVVLPIVRNTMYPGPRRACQDNLRQWGVIFKMYGKENNWYWPLPHGFESFGAASNAPGCDNVYDDFDFAPDPALVFPEYANDPLLLACPDGPDLLPPTTLGPLVTQPWRLNPASFGIAQSRSFGSCDYAGAMTNSDVSYTYLGWRIDPIDDTHPQVTREQALAAGLPATGPAAVVGLLASIQPTPTVTFRDIQARRGLSIVLPQYMDALGLRYGQYAGTEGASALPPMWHGVAINYLGTDEPPDYPWLPTTPVMWDTIYRDSSGSPVFTHRGPDGVNVLYMDGHAEFRTYPGVFPVSKTFVTMKRVP